MAIWQGRSLRKPYVARSRRNRNKKRYELKYK